MILTKTGHLYSYGRGRWVGGWVGGWVDERERGEGDSDLRRRDSYNDPDQNWTLVQLRSRYNPPNHPLTHPPTHPPSHYA